MWTAVLAICCVIHGYNLQMKRRVCTAATQQSTARPPGGDAPAPAGGPPSESVRSWQRQIQKMTAWTAFAKTIAVITGLYVLKITCAPMTAEQEENLPDFGDPKVAAKLRCSACRASAFEFWDALKALKDLRKKPAEYEVTEVMDRYFIFAVAVDLHLEFGFPF